MSSYMRDSRTPRFRCPRATPPKTRTQSLVLAYQMTQPSLGWSVITLLFVEDVHVWEASSLLIFVGWIGSGDL